jgi:aldehyde:ferredoxin oxidoreductase
MSESSTRICLRSALCAAWSDHAAVLRASQRCDELGIDTISTGGTIAFAMECVERGLLDEPWLTFGSGAALLKAIDLIGRARRLGTAARRWQPARRGSDRPGSIAFAPQVKGLEIPGYEPRGLQTMALRVRLSARAVPITIAAAPTTWTFRTRSIAVNATLDSVQSRHRERRQGRADGLAHPV